jgi:hypothetical protein
MSRKNSTSIAVILDKSSSMSTVQKATIEGFNSFLTKQKALPGEAKLTLVQFDTIYTVQMVDHPLADVPPLNELTYTPGGMTALIDAVGRGIDELGHKLSAMHEQDRPEKVIFVIITDGEENSSKEYNVDRNKVPNMITHQQEVYKWEFLYIGAGPNALQQAHALHVPKANAAAYSPGNEHEVYAVLDNSVRRGRSGQSVGYTVGERKALIDTPNK